MIHESRAFRISEVWMGNLKHDFRSDLDYPSYMSTNGTSADHIPHFLNIQLDESQRYFQSKLSASFITR